MQCLVCRFEAEKMFDGQTHQIPLENYFLPFKKRHQTNIASFVG